MSKVRVNSINPFTGQNINFGGHAIPSGSDKTLGSETNAWGELYVSTGSVNFVATVTLGQPTVTVASLKAGGEAGVSGPTQGMIFTETNNLRGSFSVGRNNIASGTASLAVGLSNTASGNYSHAQGQLNKATGLMSHAEGSSSVASGDYSHAEGNRTLASSLGAHAEGSGTTASFWFAHAEGWDTKASGYASHAEGRETLSTGYGSHAEGHYTTASGWYSHAEGYKTYAFQEYSHAEGRETVTTREYQTVVGYKNDLTESSSFFAVGTGVAGSRKNGFAVDVDPGARSHIVLPTNTSDPTNPKTGSMYFNPSTNIMYIYNGTAWKSASFA